MNLAPEAIGTVDFAAVFDVVTGPALLLSTQAPEFTVVAANQDFVFLSKRTKQAVVGHSVFAAFEQEGAVSEHDLRRRLLASFEEVMATGTEQRMPPHRFDLRSPQGLQVTCYWEAVNRPVKDAAGNVRYILHSIADVTRAFQAVHDADTMRSLRHLENILKQSSILTLIFRGEDLVLEYGNEKALAGLNGGSNILGKPLAAAIPELNNQQFPQLIRQVMETGIPYRDRQAHTVLMKDGKPTSFYYDLTYQRYVDPTDEATPRVLALGTDITEWVAAQKQLQEKTETLKLATDVSELGIFYVDLVTGIANFSERVRSWMGFETTTMPLRELINHIHPADQPLVNHIIETSIAGENGGRHDFHYRIGHNTGNLHYLRSIGQVQYKNGVPVAITGILQEETRQRLAQQKLQESEARFREMVQQAPVAMTVLRGDEFVFDIVNDQMLQHLKLDASVIGKRVLDIFPEIEQQPIWQLVLEVYHQGKNHFINNYPVEITIAGQKDLRYYTSSYVPLKEGAVTVGVLQTLIDVTDAVKARKEIEQREAMFRSLVQQTPFAAAFYKGRELVVDVANPAILELWNRDASVIGMQLKDALPELVGQQYLGLLDHVYSTGEEYIAKEEPGLLERNGKLGTFYFNYNYKPLLDTAGEVYGIINTAIDVTDQVLARKALEENEAVLQGKVAERTEQLAAANQSLVHAHDYLQLIVDHFEEAICSLQPVFKGDEVVDFCFGMTNARYAKYAAGYSPESLQGKTVGEVFPGYRSTQSFAVYREVYNTGVTQRFEQHYNTDGLDVYLIITATKMGNEVFAHFNDITELKKLQLDLLSKIRELERSNQNLEEFAHAASHDLKEPIRKVQFFTNRLKDQLIQTDEHNRYAGTFGRIESATTRMGLLIDDLLTYSHVSHRPHEKEPVDLAVKVNKVMEDLELDIQQKEAQIEVGKLPVVMGFKRQLQQMFQNLIANALKYSQEGVAPHVRITATEVEKDNRQWHHITVRDNGIGFEQEYAEKIFQMFTRLHGKHEYGGTGIGLSIVRKVIDNHGGRIEAESTPGAGSAFHIYLPAEEQNLLSDDAR